MADLESKILARELGRLGGSWGGRLGARWAAQRLPSIGHESRFVVSIPPEAASREIGDFMHGFRRPVPEYPSDTAAGRFSAIVGSGHLNLNPTILHVQIQAAPKGLAVTVRAVAKEGTIKQQSAQKLAERIEQLFAGGKV
jgi:hypothetical protein